MMIQYHMISFLAGFLLDLMIGDPYWLPHPIRLIGKLVQKLESILQSPRHLGELETQRRGSLLVILVLLCTGIISGGLLYVSYALHVILGITVEAVMTFQILALKCLKTESMKVYKELSEGNLSGARKAVSMIVGRDTQTLGEEGITKAAVETVAENCSDGVIAPLLYLAAGGPVLGFLYKAVNTMDSMIGYKNDQYRHFGRTAAKLDDAASYIPARISAVLMILSAGISGEEYNVQKAIFIYKRDRKKHASPNAAQTEAVCAGALKVQLAGDAIYFGHIVKKPFIGDADRPIEYKDIKRANRLSYTTAFLCVGICTALICVMGYLVRL